VVGAGGGLTTATSARIRPDVDAATSTKVAMVSPGFCADAIVLPYRNGPAGGGGSSLPACAKRPSGSLRLQAAKRSTAAMSRWTIVMLLAVKHDTVMV
jgi:hypothetical protein